MRIIVVTFHKAYSYGACLQAYATWKFFESKGMECLFLDYENNYEARIRNGKWLKYENTKGKIKLLIKKIIFGYGKYCKRAFGEFHSILPCIPMNEINADDILAVGSDQTWSIKICNGLDPVFLLEPFADNHKVSLASSAGDTVFTQEQLDVIIPMLNQFERLSVREECLRQQIIGKIKQPVEIILDPSLWLSRSFWINQIAQVPPVKTNYILDFVFGNTAIKSSTEIIKKYSKQLNAPVYRIMLNSYKPKYADKVIKGATPFEFLRLIYDAKLVITNSFHGVAFSINLKVPFVFLPVNNGNNQRMTELLSKLGLGNRIVLDAKSLVPFAINYSDTNMKLEKERNRTLKWLENSVLGM